MAVCAVLAAGCGEDKHPPKAPPPAYRPPPVQILGVDSYREAQRALAAGNEDDALPLLEKSIRANAKLAEAWYELGRLKVKRAPELSKTDEVAGMVMFREGLEAEREALALIDGGKAVLWSNEEQLDARARLDADLENAGDALSDEDTLREALRMRVH